MKLKSFILAMVFAAAQSAAAYTSTPVTEAPDWKVDWSYNQERPDWQAPNASDYASFTVMLIKIEEVLQPYASTDDLLAIFVGDELRGLASPAYVMGSENEPVSFVLKAFTNESSGDTMDVTLKYYCAKASQIFSLSTSIVFDSETIGVEEEFVPKFSEGSPKYPVVNTIDAADLLAQAGITPADGDQVAVFVGDECRGVLTLPLEEGELLDVYLREEGEEITLMYYDSTNQRILTLAEGGEEVFMKGDANGDGVVDVSDYIAIANYILGDIPEGFKAQAADVNDDGIIDVSDYIGVANIILYGNINGK